MTGNQLTIWPVLQRHKFVASGVEKLLGPVAVLAFLGKSTDQRAPFVRGSVGLNTMTAFGRTMAPCRLPRFRVQRNQ